MILIFGGVTDSGRNDKILIFNLQKPCFEEINVNPLLQERIKVFGSSLHQFSSHSYIMLGGSLGPPGSCSGRQIFSYSKLNKKGKNKAK